jgi:hypothetical protein
MKPLLLNLGCFVAGVLVGAGLWFALILCVVGMALWWFGESSTDRRERLRSSLKHIETLGPRPRDRGR